MGFRILLCCVGTKDQSFLMSSKLQNSLAGNGFRVVTKLRRICEQGFMCRVEKEEAEWWRTEVILSWETNHPCVLSSKGSLGGRTFSPETKTVPATLGSQPMDSSVWGTHSSRMEQTHPAADLLQREENTPKIS